MLSSLTPHLIRYYAEVKRQYPAEGRRKWKLRAAQRLWTNVGPGGFDLGHSDSQNAVSTYDTEFNSDPDPLDGVTCDAPELGLIIRSDYSDNAAWTAFCTRLQDSEEELICAGSDHDGDDNTPAAPEEENSDDEDEQDGPPRVFHIINPCSPQERELLEKASNLTLLRLFNDVDVRLSPVLPHGTKRINPPNRLIDYHGLQEVYQGKNIWIYDTTSNIDQSVRVVSQHSGMYGTATGDSWRARVSHVCELQVHLSSGGMQVDFGGLDRWDSNERMRNMVEAERE